MGDPARAEQTPDAVRAVPRQWRVLAVIGVAQLMVVLDATIVNIALPVAQSDLRFGDGNRAWVITAYALAFGGLLLLGGRVADMIGHRTAFIAGLVGFAVASAFGGAATTFGTLVIARAMQGAFGALLAPAALALLTTTFATGKDRDRAFAVFGAIAGSGGAIGLLLGGLLTEYFGWRWTLFVNIAFAGVALVGTLTLVPRTRRVRAVRLDLPGALAVSAGLFALVYGPANAERHGWSAFSTWATLLVGAVLLGSFVVWQTRAPGPLLPLRVVTERNRAASFTAVAVVGTGMFAMFLFLNYYLQQNLHFSPIRSGVAFLPVVAGMMISSGLATSILVPRMGPKPVVPSGMLIAAAGMFWFSLLEVGSAYATDVLPALVVVGFGLGAVLSPALSLATYAVSERDAGVASATVNASMQIGGSIGTTLLNTLATTAAASHLAGYSPRGAAVLAQASLHGYSIAFTTAAAVFVVGAVVIGALYRTGTLVGPDPSPGTSPKTAGATVGGSHHGPR
jgi:EmrB/QacA subfamily drug resistance transporter